MFRVSDGIAELAIFVEAVDEEIVEQMSAVRDWGGKFVVPIPEVIVLD